MAYNKKNTEYNKALEAYHMGGNYVTPDGETLWGDKLWCWLQEQAGAMPKPVSAGKNAATIRKVKPHTN